MPSGELRNTGFVVDLFMDADRNLVTTQVLHVDSNEGESWSGWDAEQMYKFFAEHAGIESRQPPIPAAATSASTTPSATLSRTEMPPAPKGPVTLKLDEVKIIPEGAAGPSQIVVDSNPFDLDLSVRVAGPVGTRAIPYTAYVHARRAGGGRVVLAEHPGELQKTQETIRIRVPAGKLPQGAYSLTTYIILSGTNTKGLSGLPGHALATSKLLVAGAAS